MNYLTKLHNFYVRNVKIRTKIFSFIAIFFALSISADCILLLFETNKEIDGILEEFALQDFETSLEILESEVKNMNIQCQDWAIWDETYNFMVDQSDEYYDNNLSFAGFGYNDVDYLFIIDNENRQLFGGQYLDEEVKEVQLIDLLYIDQNELNLLTSFETLDEYKKGIINSKHGLLMAGSRPITNSIGDAPIRGTMIMINKIEHVINRINKDSTNFSVEIFNINEAELDDRLHDIIHQLTTPDDRVVGRYDDKVLETMGIVQNILDEPVLMFISQTPRHRVSDFQKMVKFHFYIRTFISLILILLLLFLFRRFVLKRIEQQRNRVSRISSLKDLSQRLEAKGTDEMSLLALDINKMLDRLENADKEYRKLGGLLPICANCKKIRDDKGYWNQIEHYITDHSEAEFTHGMCENCQQELYGDLMKTWEKKPTD